MSSVKMMQACVKAGGWAHLECSPFLSVGKDKKFEDLEDLLRRCHKHMLFEDLMGDKWVCHWPRGWYWVRDKYTKEAQLAFCDGGDDHFCWVHISSEDGHLAANTMFDRIVPADVSGCPFKAKGPFNNF